MTLCRHERMRDMNDAGSVVTACLTCGYPHGTTCNVCGQVTCSCPTCDIYLRLSEDKYGDELGIGRQYDECEPKATANGWRIRHVWADNDLSATTGVARPKFDGLLASNPERVLCWHSDRLVRRSDDLERVIALNINIHTIHAGQLDLSTPAGRAVAKTVTAWAQYEGEQKAERQRAKHRQRVKSGTPWWPTRPFGFEMDGTHREDEAQALRETYAAILNGTSLRKATKMLGERFRTPKGNEWRASSLRPILVNPRNAGIYSYNGEEVGPASWEPIVPEDVFRAVVRILNSPDRRKNWGRGGYNKRENLLTGIAQCSHCGTGVRAGYRRNKAGEVTYKTYQCGGCFKVTLPAEWCDSVVCREVIKRVEVWRDMLPQGPQGADIDVAALRAEEVALGERKAELVEDRALGYISREDMRAGIAKADERLAEIADLFNDNAMRGNGTYFWDTETLWSWTDDGEGKVDIEKFTPVVKRVCKSIKVTGPGKGKKDLYYGTHLVIEFNDPALPAPPKKPREPDPEAKARLDKVWAAAEAAVTGDG